ncbi:MAG: hypothetical protein Q4C60_11405, partial [Eubacteriales bacterium]|nr:hypothetical protein [Eubacteriales bacterium]
MESYIIFFIVMAGLLLLLALMGMVRERKQLAEFRSKVRESFGHLPDSGPDPERYAHIAGYYRKHRTPACIDDITWNDLDMDRIYAQINACHSAAGEEYLYALLHMPAFAAEQEALSEEQLDYLRGHEQERTQLQMLFARLGTTGKYSLYDYLDYLDQLGKRSNARHYLALFLPIASVGVMFVSTQIGILCFVAALCYNMNTYFREKRKIDPYLVSFRYLMRLMNCAQQIGTALGRFRQGEQGTQPFGQESAELAALSAEFKSFRFGSGLLLYESVGSGNPLDIFLDYIRLLFHLDIIKFNSMLAEVWNKREKIDRMVTVVGRIETEICVASYREALPYYAIPELREWTAASADCSQPAMAAQTV